MKISENLSITFLVEKPEMSKDGRVPVIVRVTLNGQRTEISLGARIFPEQWDLISGRVKGKSPDALLLNNQITQTKAKLEKCFFLLTTQHEFVTADMIRKSYKGKLVMPGNPDGPDEKKTFMQAVAFEIGRLKEKHEKGLRAKSTITKWESTRTKLEAFVLYTYKKADTPMGIIRPNFAEDMLHYFMVKEDLDHNTALKYIQNTKQVLTTATGRWIKSNPIRDFRCSYKQPERDDQ
jgi:Arm DNA-binding domain/Phage integrase SAM-like domain